MENLDFVRGYGPYWTEGIRLMKKIVVTGGSGRSGRVAIRHLLKHGYEVLNLDVMPPQDQITPFFQVDLADYTTTFTAMHGYDAVVHLGSDPRPDDDLFTGAERFRNNTMGTYNVFNAAVRLGMERVVWASSETLLGLPFEDVLPKSVPITEEHDPMPRTNYAISKLVCEQIAREYNTLHGMPFIGLRLSNIYHIDPNVNPNYSAVPTFWDDAQKRRFNLWSYIDAEDVAQAIRLGLESDITGAEVFIIAARDTNMNRPSRDLMAEVFPEVPVDDGLGEFDSLLSSEKARRMLGFEQQYSWRNRIEAR
jgi:nucleoside-diphosphate-sugar epimerase